MMIEMVWGERVQHGFRCQYEERGPWLFVTEDGRFVASYLRCAVRRVTPAGDIFNQFFGGGLF